MPSKERYRSGNCGQGDEGPFIEAIRDYIYDRKHGSKSFNALGASIILSVIALSVASQDANTINDLYQNIDQSFEDMLKLQPNAFSVFVSAAFLSAIYGWDQLIKYSKLTDDEVDRIDRPKIIRDKFRCNITGYGLTDIGHVVFKKEDKLILN